MRQNVLRPEEKKRGRSILTGNHLVSYCAVVETVFRALADPTRRALLDALFEQDGQTLVALTARPRHDADRASPSISACSRRPGSS